MSSKEISLTPSDVSNQTTPRIVKPPYFNDVDSEEDIDEEFDVPRPPPDDHLIHTDGQGEDESAKSNNRHDRNGPGDEKREALRSKKVIELDDDPVRDGDGKTTKEINDVGSGAANGKEDEEEEKNGSDDGIIPAGGQRTKATCDVKVDADNVNGLVDRIESAVEAVSKDEPRAFDSLVASLRVFLPLTLYMADELQTIRGNKKDLILRNRSLMKENQQIRQEAEKSIFLETKTIGTTTSANMANEENHLDRKQGDENKSKQLEEDSRKREVKKLRLQIKELQQVNQSWEKYTQKKCGRYESDLRKMSTKLAQSEEKSKGLEKRLDEKFRQYDQTLMDARHSEERQKAVAGEYKKERDVMRMKYDEMKRQGKAQDDEIKRLKEVIAGKAAAKVYMKPAAFVVTQQARVVDDTHIQAPYKKVGRNEKQGAMTAAVPAVTAVGPPANRDKNKKKEDKPQTKRPMSPVSPRGPPGYMNGDSPISLTREELKDQVVLYKEQMDVYRSDFIQERQDREKAVGQVDSLKKELDKTKKKLKEMHRQRMEEEHDLYVAARVGGAHMHFLPEDTQEMRLREIKQETRGKGKYTAHGRKHVEANLGVTEAERDRLEGHLYAEIE